MDEGDAGLLLQGVHVLHDGALGLAHVDDHLGLAGEQGLQIQLALAAVQLAQQGQVIVLLVQKLLGALVPLVGHAHQLIGAQGEHHDLGQRAGHGHLVDPGRNGDLATGGIGKHAGLCGGIVLILRRGVGLTAAGSQTQGHHQRQQQRQQSFGLFHPFSPFSLSGISHVSQRRRPKRRL